ncbi:Transposon TX1 uncharacterized 149 kDa protein [Linum grandiflorum]
MLDTHPDKAPGPNGFNPGFYQQLWDEIGDDVVHAYMQWLQQGGLPKDVQQTTTVLIPKVQSPESMKDFRPISLCNVLYRLIAKVTKESLSSG